MIPSRIFQSLCLIVLAITFMGAESMSCSCSGSASDLDLVTSGGEVAVSDTYSLMRAEMGTSFEEPTSADGLYRINATVGNHLAEVSTTSTHYTTYHILTRRVLTDYEDFLIEEGTDTTGTETDTTSE